MTAQKFPSRIALAGACAALAAMAAAAPQANAAKNPPKNAVYELQLKGDESVVWTYKAPADGCFYGADGGGSQQVSYETKKLKVKAVRTEGGDRQGRVQLALKSDTLAQYGAVQGLPGVARVDREGEITSSAGCGGTGGSTQAPPPVDCGIRWGRVQLTAGFHAPIAFSVTGKYDNFATVPEGETDDLVPPFDPPESGDHLGAVYTNCPLLLPSGSAAAYDELTTAAHKLRERQLPKKGKTLKLSGGDQDEATSDDGERTSQTSVAWNLKLKRIK